MILHESAQTVTVQPTVTNGAHDLLLEGHISAGQEQLILYRFDGSDYRAAVCGYAKACNAARGQIPPDHKPSALGPWAIRRFSTLIQTRRGEHGGVTELHPAER